MGKLVQHSMFAPVLHIIGLLTIFLGLLMIAPALADLVVNNKDWQVFATAS